MKHWYVVRSKHGQDLRAAQELRQQNYRVYVAKKYERRVVDKRRSVIVSLRFNGYVFVAFDTERQEHGPINNTRGVAQILCDISDRPQPIPSSIIETIRQCEDVELETCTKRIPRKVRRDLKPGTTVKLLTEDIWRGKTGLLLGVHKGIAKVLVGTFVVTPRDVDVMPLETPLADAKRKRA